MRFLSLSEVLELHHSIIKQSGGSFGLRDFGTLQSALAQPRMTFAESELYPSIEEKATALCFSLVSNHPFVDGNKRIGHAVMETFLVLNGFEIIASVDESEETILNLAAGELSRVALLEWIREHIVKRENLLS